MSSDLWLGLGIGYCLGVFTVGLLMGIYGLMQISGRISRAEEQRTLEHEKKYGKS